MNRVRRAARHWWIVHLKYTNTRGGCFSCALFIGNDNIKANFAVEVFIWRESIRTVTVVFQDTIGTCVSHTVNRDLTFNI